MTKRIDHAARLENIAKMAASDRVPGVAPAIVEATNYIRTLEGLVLVAVPIFKWDESEDDLDDEGKEWIQKVRALGLTEE